MSKAHRPTKGVVVFLIALLVVVLIGCGGGGGGGTGGGTSATAGGTSTSGSTGSGSLLYTIEWPVSSRSIPPYALSVVLTAYDFGTTNIVDQIVLNRSNNKAAYNATVTFHLPPGKYTIVAEAKPDPDGGGDTLASDTVTQTVVNGGSATTTLVFANLIESLFIDDLPTQATVGQSFQINAHAEDSGGNAILLPSEALDWTITSGGQFANITSDGVFTVLGEGSVTIQVREIDTGLTATKSITLVQGTTNEVVIIVS